MNTANESGLIPVKGTQDSYMEGFWVAVGTNAAIGLTLFLITISGGLVFGLFILLFGVVQFLWIVPMAIAAHQEKKKEYRNGLLCTALLTALISALFTSYFLANFHPGFFGD